MKSRDEAYWAGLEYELGRGAALERALNECVVGERIVAVEERDGRKGKRLVLTLESGRRFVVKESHYCCADTQLRSWVGGVGANVISAVTVNGSYDEWTLLADGTEWLKWTSEEWDDSDGRYMLGLQFSVMEVQDYGNA